MQPRARRHRVERHRAPHRRSSPERDADGAALTVADELADTGNRLRRLEEEVAGLQETRATAVERVNATQAAVAAALNAAAERIEKVTKALNQGRPVGVALG